MTDSSVVNILQNWGNNYLPSLAFVEHCNDNAFSSGSVKTL
jgi:hypothetical protein